MPFTGHATLDVFDANGAKVAQIAVVQGEVVEVAAPELGTGSQQLVATDFAAPIPFGGALQFARRPERWEAQIRGGRHEDLVIRKGILGGSKPFRYLARLLLFLPSDQRMRPSHRRTPPRLGPVVIALAAGAIVVLSGVAVNGCRISKLLSSSTAPPGDTSRTGPGGGGVIVLVPSVVNDSAIAGTDTMRVTNVAVTNGGSWGATTDDSWIHLSPTSGGPRATLRISLDPKDLSPGVHRGEVTVQEHADEDTRAKVSVTFRIQQPILELEPERFKFEARNSNTVFYDTLYITNDGTGPLVWTATTERHSRWLRFESDTTGTAPSALVIRASNEGLSYFGTYRDFIIVSSPGAKESPKKVEVTIRRRHGGGDDDDDSPVP